MQATSAGGGDDGAEQSILLMNFSLLPFHIQSVIESRISDRNIKKASHVKPWIFQCIVTSPNNRGCLLPSSPNCLGWMMSFIPSDQWGILKFLSPNHKRLPDHITLYFFIEISKSSKTSSFYATLNLGNCWHIMNYANDHTVLGLLAYTALVSVFVRVYGLYCQKLIP